MSWDKAKDKLLLGLIAVVMFLVITAWNDLNNDVGQNSRDIAGLRMEIRAWYASQSGIVAADSTR